jgi:hypothetical protein
MAWRMAAHASWAKLGVLVCAKRRYRFKCGIDHGKRVEGFGQRTHYYGGLPS